jgi:hypothetical protein
MLCLRWHWISGGRAAGTGRTQDLPSGLQAVFWQGPDKVGLGREPIIQWSANVRFGANLLKSDIAALPKCAATGHEFLFDHLVGPNE